MSATEQDIYWQIFQAIRDHNLGRVEELVSSHGLPLMGGYDFLCDAINLRQTDIAVFLVQNGARVNTSKPIEPVTPGFVELTPWANFPSRSRRTHAFDPIQECIMSHQIAQLRNPELSLSHGQTTPLHAAAGCGCLELAEALIVKGAHLDATDRNRSTALHIAVEKGHENIVQLLLNKNAVCCLKNNDDLEPLDIACNKRFFNIFKILLRFCVQNMDASSPSFFRVLSAASRDGQEDFVSSLLNLGVDPHRHAFFIACQEGHAKIVDLFLAHGAEVDYSKADDKYTPLHVASENDHVKIVSALIRKNADVNAKATGNRTPLHLAAEKGCLEIVRMLVDNGGCVNSTTDTNATPLFLAVKQGHEEVSLALLNQKACVNMQDENKDSPLYIAVNNKNSILVNHLLQFGPEIDDKVYKLVLSMIINDTKDNSIVGGLISHGFTLKREDVNDSLLPAAVRKGYTKIIQSLLDYGVDPTDVKYGTLLHTAVDKRHKEVIQLLLNAGCNINAKDSKGNTPICFSMNCSVEDDCDEIIRLLLHNGADVADVLTLLHKTVDKECIDVCRVLIENGSDVDARNHAGLTPLHVAASNKKTFFIHPRKQEEKIDDTARGKIIQLLLENKANINVETEDGFLAIHLAAVVGRHEAVRVLLEGGGHVDSRTADGLTSLHLASLKGHAETVRTLLDFDADIDAVNSLNETALHCAVSEKHYEVVTVLLENGCDVNLANSSGQTTLEVVVSKEISSRRFPVDTRYLYDNRDRWDFILEVLVKHVIKLKVVGLHLNEKLINLVEFNPERTNFQLKCAEELTKIKNNNWDHILMNPGNPAFARNVSLVQAFECFDHQAFPIYGSLLVNNFKKIQRKNELFIPGQKSLDFIMKISNTFNERKLPFLPIELQDLIVSYLSIKDVKSLICCCETLKNKIKALSTKPTKNEIDQK